MQSLRVVIISLKIALIEIALKGPLAMVLCFPGVWQGMNKVSVNIHPSFS